MPGEGFFGHRNSFRRSKGEEPFDSEVARKKAERSVGAEVHEQEMEEYKKTLREQIEREGIESVNMADFFCTAEYLRGAINKKTMEENKELLGFFGAQLDEYEDEGLMLHALIQEAQPQYFKDAVTVDSALRDRQSQCYAAAQTTLALMAGSEKLRSMPKKLQWYKEHVRVIVEREGKWYALEQPTWDEIVPEGFAGTILTDQYTAVHGFLGESIESEFIEMDGTHKAHVVNTDYETNSKLQPYELNFKSEPVISYEGRVPERPSGRQYSYKEGKNQVVLKKILQKVMKALGVDSVTRKAFILASIISATGVLAVDKGSRDAVTTGLEQMVKRIDHWAHDKEWYENEDEYKKYLESFFNPDGSFEYHQFIQRVGYADFFLQLEYLHGHPATGVRSPSKDAKHTLDDKVKKWIKSSGKISINETAQSRKEAAHDFIQDEGDYSPSQFRLTELVNTGFGNDEARVKYFLSRLFDIAVEDSVHIICYTDRMVVALRIGSDLYALEKPTLRKLSIDDIRGTTILHPRAFVQNYLGKEMTVNHIPSGNAPEDKYVPRNPDHSFRFNFGDQAPTRKFEPSEALLAAEKINHKMTAEEADKYRRSIEAKQPMLVRYLGKVAKITNKKMMEKSKSSDAAKQSYNPISDNDLVEAAVPGEFTEINLPNFSDQNIAEIEGFPVKSLTLFSPSLTEQGFARLIRGLPKLEKLYIDSPGGGDEERFENFLFHLRGSSVKLLVLTNVAVSNIEGLRGVPLTFLTIIKNSGTVTDLTPLSGAPLRGISLDENPGLTRLNGLDLDQFKKGKLEIILGGLIDPISPDDGVVDTENLTINWDKVGAIAAREAEEMRRTGHVRARRPRLLFTPSRDK